MARWTPVPVAGGAYSDDCLPWSSQDTVNYIPVKAEREGARSMAMLRCLPGCVTFSVTGSNAPVRGARNVEGKLFAVSGNHLYRVGTDGAATSLGVIPGTSRVSMAHNQIAGGNEVAIANGLSGYIYNTATETLAQITDEGFPGAKVFGFIDGYLMFVEPQGRFWGWSDLAAGTSYNTLDRSEAEAQPDRIVTGIETHGEWFVLGERSGEFYRNTGATTGTFQRIDGTTMEVGCAATHAAAKLDNSVFWLGSDGIVYRLNGYQPQRISTHAIEQAISRCNMAQAFATTFEDRGHKVFYLTFPDGKTWGFDVATGEWHRRRSDGLDRWRMNTLTHWNGVWIAGDYSNGKLYQLDWAVQHEAGAEMERRRIFPVMHDNQNRLTVNAVEFVFDTGLSEASDPLPTPILSPLTISGDLPDGSYGEASTGTYTASGGVLPYGAVTVTGGTFPPGLTLAADGSWSGTHAAAGPFAWTVGGVDADGTPLSLADSATVTALETIALGQADYLSGTRYVLASPDGLDWNDPYRLTSGTGTPLFNNGGHLMSAAGTLLAWGSGASSNKPCRSTDKGATWTATASTYTMGSKACEVSGAILIGAHTGNMWRSTDGGATFANVGNNQKCIAALSPTGLLAVARCNSGGGVTQITTDGGATWSAGPADPLWSSNIGGGGSDGTHIYLGGSVFVAGPLPKLVKTTNGAAYTTVTLPTFATATTITCFAAFNGIKVVGTDSGEIAVDSGAGFVLAASSLGKKALNVLHNGAVFVMLGDTGSGGAAGVIKTSVDGVTWTAATLTTPIVLTGLAMVSP